VEQLDGKVAVVTGSGRGLGRMDAGLRLLASVDPVVLEPEHANDEGQGQPLPDERREDDREGEEENQVTAWKGYAGIGLERQGECCCERQRTSHTGPGEKDGARGRTLARRSRSDVKNAAL